MSAAIYTGDRSRRMVGVVTVARSDYGIYRPVLRRIEASEALDLRVFVGGMHLAPQYGLTVREIEADGLTIADRVEMLVASDSPSGIATSMGLGVIGFSQAFSRTRPDILLLLGDRFEMYAAGLAALPSGIPIAHIHGGETTEGAMDEAIRHALTKMSHLHFPSTEDYARRIVQMGEEPWRVTVSGAPSLDNIGAVERLDRDALRARFGLRIPGYFVLVTFHPVTLEYQRTGDQMEALLSALEGLDAQGIGTVFTYPNADTSNQVIIEAIDRFVAGHPLAEAVVSLGTAGYFSMMREARAMVGNSSSGIIEAASFHLPVLNIGDRQKGRVHGANVLDVPAERNAIHAGLARVLSPAFRESLGSLANPYGDGRAAERIVSRIETVKLSPALLKKHFHDLPADLVT